MTVDGEMRNGYSFPETVAREYSMVSVANYINGSSGISDNEGAKNHAKADPIARRIAIITDRLNAKSNRFIINVFLYLSCSA